MNDPNYIENRTFDELKLGDSASISRTLTAEDIKLFALVSGDVNPAHLDPDYAATDMFHRVIAHGMWGGGLISAVLGTQLPGPGTIYLDQSFRFRRPVGLGDEITATVVVKEKRPDKQIVILDCRCTNQLGEEVITGEAEVIAPAEKVRRRRVELPDFRLATHEHYRRLLERVRGGTPLPTAVVHPCDPAAIAAAIEAHDAGIVMPILVGPRRRIEAAAQEAGADISAFELVDAPHSHAAAHTAVAMVRDGKAKLLMKGALHTDELMGAVVCRENGLRTERRISHAYVMDVPGRAEPLIITDAAINIAPDLDAKADIVRNAVDLAKVIGIATPKVAILGAVETVNPAMPATLDAAALCKMADRGQIEGAILDGPLALDNAVSVEAAREKGIVSPVAGCADVLLVPNIEAGNMLAKQLTFLGNADAAGVVLGARVPIVLTSRADSLRTRLASCAVAVLLARAATLAAPGLPQAAE
ncbi:enoyl-CoA hydratase [Altererythrobacter sp. B11]|uniref:bifunctional enoyl-CoA hydratase/phosphate acetyltransferase n=1 Tax=Altererythrobacter sp. B11 TaxID=2060312 RepID=UPI000DC71256|nr:bifunctional enoyl-CoA hydratase/phosphate acetyltransferase [Altererythrobacter sp. B11]BBC73957.1 enoyl-CoA hydratase [Altererythrobacter sp. B11]